MKHILIAAGFALAAAFALADGVPLITAGSPIAANSPIRQSAEAKSAAVVKLHPVTINKSAFGSNVVTVMVDGKEHRFVGGSPPARTGLLGDQKIPAQPEMKSWRGTEKVDGQDLGSLSLTKDVKSDTVLGVMEIYPNRYFTFTSGRGVMVEKNPNLFPRPVLVMPASGVKK